MRLYSAAATEECVMSSGWSLYVTLITVVFMGAACWLVWWQRKGPPGNVGAGESMGHDFDGIQELNNPLPRWWLGTFVGAVIFAAVYLVLYPGLGAYPGLLGWSSRGEYDGEIKDVEAKYGPLYDRYGAMAIPDLLAEEPALRIGERIFANNCSRCHGADARGGVGFPNLTDGDWLFGGEPDVIETTILGGRIGMMPAFAPAIGGEAGIPAVVAYVRSLSGNSGDPQLIEQGKAKFASVCFACHGADGKGNKILGAPNLTDDIWLFGGTPDDVAYGLRNGRRSQMPAHADLLDKRKVHLAAAYVYSLSHGLSEESEHARGAVSPAHPDADKEHDEQRKSR